MQVVGCAVSHLRTVLTVCSLYCGIDAGRLTDNDLKVEGCKGAYGAQEPAML